MDKKISCFLRKNAVVLASILLLSACSTDLAVIGDYKETMVVYGLLDQSQSKQYIKINKAFLGEGNSFGYAQVKDSTQYVNSLSVVLKSIKNGVELNSYNLSPDNTIAKAPGTFYGPDQTNAIYSFSSTGGNALNSDNTYKLIIKSNETGTEVSSQTSLITDAAFTSPSPGAPFFHFILSGNDNYQYPVRWTSGKNARLYQMILRLNYIDSTTTGNLIRKLDWVFPEQKTQSLAGGETMKNDFVGQNFMQFVGNQLSDYSGLIARRALNAELIVIAGGDDLNTFIEVNKPSTSVVQEKPEFTNITNGLGVFSSRYNSSQAPKPLGSFTWDALACGQYTSDLKFLDKDGAFCQ